MYASAVADKAFVAEISLEDARHGRFAVIGSPDSEKPVVLVWGDSHAMAAGPAIDRLLRDCGRSGRLATHSATAPVLGAYWKRTRYGLKEDAPEFGEAVFRFVRDTRIPHVVLIARWAAYRKSDGPLVLHEAVLSTVKRLVDIGAQPWIMLEVPQYDFNVPRALALSAAFGRDVSRLVSPRKTDGCVFGGDKEARSLVEAAGARIIDPRPSFLDGDGRSWLIAKNGLAIYRDREHLSAFGAESVLLPFLRRTFLPAILESPVPKPPQSAGRSRPPP